MTGKSKLFTQIMGQVFCLLLPSYMVMFIDKVVKINSGRSSISNLNHIGSLFMEIKGNIKQAPSIIKV